MLNNTYFLNNKFILLQQHLNRLIQLNPFRNYSLNKTGADIIRNLKQGATFDQLVASLSLKNEKDMNSLQKFLDQAIQCKILSHDRNSYSALRIVEARIQPQIERIFMEVTSRCNFYCKHCYMSAHQQVDTTDEMTLDEIKDIISWANNSGVFRIDFTGGELFVRKDVKEILKFAAEKLMITNIFTNGYSLNTETCKFLSELGNVKIVFISIDDIDPEKHDAFRGKVGSHAKIIEGIACLKSLGMRVVVNITLNEENSGRIKQVIDYCRNSIGVECRVEGSKISPELIIETMDYSIGDMLGHMPDDDLTLDEGIYEPSCGVGHSMLYIRANGELCLCPTLSSRESDEFYLGNIRTHDIKDVWQNSQKVKAFRDNQCKMSDCKYMEKCRGGCRSRAYLQKSQMNDVDQIVCDYFAKIHSSKYIINPHCEFAMQRHPIAVVKGSSKTIALTQKNIAFLKSLENTEYSFRELIEKYQTIDHDVDASKVIRRLIDEKLLMPTKKYEWRSNAFGASLVDEQEIYAVEKVLKSKVLCRNNNVKLKELDHLIPSPCYLFEKQLSEMIGAKYVTVLNSGTSALECALKAIGISNREDEVIVPCYTYIGTISAVLSVGGKPVLCDINEDYSIDCQQIETLITPNTKAIIVVHLRGRSVNIESLMKIANKYGIYVIEDCAQAIGSYSNDKHVGSIGHIGCFSFHEHKLVSTGEGGAIATNSSIHHNKIRLLCDASRIFAYPDSLPGVPGHNYRMTEIQAAIGLTQMKRLPQIKEYLTQLYQVFAEELQNIDKIRITPYCIGDIPQSVYLYCKQADLAKKLEEFINTLGVPASLLYKEDAYNHDVYIDWPYVMEMLGHVKEWKTERHKLPNLFPNSINKLQNTINISLGMQVRKETAYSLCQDIIEYLK
jgi:radical SAM protein with 4Fe4S-binding SPASM domain